MKIDPVLRWWSILTVAAASFSIGQIVGEPDATGFAQKKSAECGLPAISKFFLPHAETFGLYGAVLAVIIIAVALAGFRLFSSEEARYRLVIAINTIAWPIVLLSVATFFLAAFALPYAKCAAAA